MSGQEAKYTRLPVRTLGPGHGLTLEQYRDIPEPERPAPLRGTREQGTPRAEEVPDWRDRGACKGQPADLWFADEGGNSTYADGKRVCASCAVKPECLEWALATAEPFGLWGGLTPRERSKVLRGRDQAPLRARNARTATSLRGMR